MSSKNDELLFAILPEGLSDWFEIESFTKTPTHLRIYLLEKNIPPDTGGKKIINTIIKRSYIDDFPIRSRKVELAVGRRYWKLEGEEKLLKREISLASPNTRLEKEFADFLKEADRRHTSPGFPAGSAVRLEHQDS